MRWRRNNGACGEQAVGFSGTGTDTARDNSPKLGACHPLLIGNHLVSWSRAGHGSPTPDADWKSVYLGLALCRKGTTVSVAGTGTGAVSMLCSLQMYRRWTQGNISSPPAPITAPHTAHGAGHVPQNPPTGRLCFAGDPGSVLLRAVAQSFHVPFFFSGSGTWALSPPSAAPIARLYHQLFLMLLVHVLKSASVANPDEEGRCARQQPSIPAGLPMQPNSHRAGPDVSPGLPERT